MTPEFKQNLIIIIVSVAAALSLATAVFWVVRTIRHQHKLRFSVTVIELKTNKFFYWLLNLLLIAGAGWLVASFIFPNDFPYNILTKELYNFWGLDTVIVRLVIGLLIVIDLSVLAISVAMTFSKSAVVNDGIYTAMMFVDWHHLYDFYFEEKKNIVVISSDPGGALTLSGTSTPLKFKSKDRPRLKFLLVKNKNKFVTKV